MKKLIAVFSVATYCNMLQLTYNFVAIVHNIGLS